MSSCIKTFQGKEYDMPPRIKKLKNLYENQKPTISMSSVIPSKTPFLSLIILKSVVPGQKSSVCIHRIIPTFISIHFINFEI